MNLSKLEDIIDALQAMLSGDADKQGIFFDRTPTEQLCRLLRYIRFLRAQVDCQTYIHQTYIHSEFLLMIEGKAKEH